MNVGHVEGGTNAGWRIVKQAHQPWFCSCWEVVGHRIDAPEELAAMKKLNPGYRGNCDDCGERRPS